MIERRRERTRCGRSREVLHGLLLSACLLGCGLVGRSPARAQTQRTAVLDRVVADVDGQAILASDVDDEMRFSALLPGVEPAADNTPQRAMNRVIDRTLIDQQRALQPGVAVVSQKDVEHAIATMRQADFGGDKHRLRDGCGMEGVSGAARIYAE